MGSGNPVNGITQGLGDIFSGNIGTGLGKVVSSSIAFPLQSAGALIDGLNPKAPSTPTLPTPTTSEPTISQTNTTAIQNELANEQNATATVFNGGRGVTQPTTAAHILMGR